MFRGRSVAVAVWLLGSGLLTGQTNQPTGAAIPDMVLTREVPNSQLGIFFSLGERLRKAGKERAVLVGSLARAAETSVVVVTRENGDKLRVDEVAGGQNRAAVFDGDKGSYDQNKQGDSEDLLETALHDSAEHFFTANVAGGGKAGISIRYLGSGFGLAARPGDKYSGPFYQVFELTETIQPGVTAARRSKLYYFNQQNGLLEKVRYSVVKSGVTVPVEVTLSGWTDFQGEKFPVTVERTESGKATLTLRFSQVTTGPKSQDQKFSGIQ